MSHAVPAGTAAYPDRPLTPQIIRDAPLLTLVLAAEAQRLRPYVPAPLTPHPEAKLILNIWALADPQATTGFGAPGPIGVSYLAAEVAGPEGASADGAVRFPGRFWLAHWNSSAAARRYARASAGVEMDAGETEVELRGDRLSARLTLDGVTVIEASARISTSPPVTRAGHSVYYAERAAAGGGREVARFDVPWVADAYSAAVAEVAFHFPPRSLAAALVGTGSPSIVAASFRRMTLVPYLASGRLA